MKFIRPNSFFADVPSGTFICPKCKEPTLLVDESSFDKVETGYSKVARDHPDWDPDWIIWRFSFRSVCSTKNCGEVCTAAGWGQVDQRYDDDWNPEYFKGFNIKSFWPSPDLIATPKELPTEVKELLEKSFVLFWPDPAAAANALRASLEHLLDELKVPRTKTKRAGEDYRLSLHSRIEIVAEQQPDFKVLLLALKEVGNLGSHGETVSTKDYLDALEIYVHTLEELYDNKGKRVLELALKLREKLDKKA